MIACARQVAANNRGAVRSAGGAAVDSGNAYFRLNVTPAVSGKKLVEPPLSCTRK
jgi:hypothetical protein